MKVLLLFMLGTFVVVLWMTNRGRTQRMWPILVLSLIVGAAFYRQGLI